MPLREEFSGDSGNRAEAVLRSARKADSINAPIAGFKMLGLDCATFTAADIDGGTSTIRKIEHRASGWPLGIFSHANLQRRKVKGKCRGIKRDGRCQRTTIVGTTHLSHEQLPPLH